MAQADIGSKRLIGLAPGAWLEWVTGISGITAGAILTPEFQWIGRTEDILIEAYTPSIGRFVVANGIQLRYRSNVPRRVRAYSALAEEKFQLPVYAVLVNILPSASVTQIRDRFDSTVLGQRALQEYKVLNLWDVDAEIVFERQIAPLLPFVPILKGGGDEKTVRRALRELRSNSSLDEMEPLLAFFATFVLDSELVQRIMRWDMSVLLESPWYNEILDAGMKQGLQHAVINAFEIRFGLASPAIRDAIAQVRDTSRLDELQRIAIRAQSPAEFEQELGV